MELAINGVSYNKYLYTGIKGANNSFRNSCNKNFTASLPALNKDTFELTQLTKNQVNIASEISKTTQELEEIKSKQGLIGKLWDGFKNLTGIGASSSKAQKAIEDFRNGKITSEEMNKAVIKYQEGQKQCVDTVADIISGIGAFGAFAFATGIGLAAAPFTGGASLGLVLSGFGFSGVIGAGLKVGIKGIDSAIGGRKYDSFGYDLATGGINGMFAPITAGIGGAAGKAVAGKVGVKALRDGGEIVVKEAIKGSAKGNIIKTLLTTNIKYTGGTLGARALALTTDMAVNGAITGAVDSGTRYVAGDSENKTVKGFAKEVELGTLGGLIMAPIIGGGMRVLGNSIGKLTGKLQTKVSTNYSKAKSALMNTPVSENPDIEIIKGFEAIIEQGQDLVDGFQGRGLGIIDGIDRNIFDLSDNVSDVIQKAMALNAEMNTMSKENRQLVLEILKELSQGKDVSSKIAELSKKGIFITDIIDSKVGVFSDELEERLSKIMAANDALTQKASAGVECASQTIENKFEVLNETIEQARKIPQTNAYEQLGDLPKRIRALYSSISSDASALNNKAQMARNKILSGDIQDGLEDLIKYYDELDAFNLKLEQQITSVQSSASRSGMEESADVLRKRLERLTATEEFKKLPRKKQIQAIMEESNILLAKFAQTFSSDKSLPDNVLSVLKEFTSKGITFREIPEAQKLADELYGAGKYTITAKLKAGTIGETYLAQTKDGSEVILKMLKDGVTPEKFAQDRAMFIKYINEFVTDSTEREYKLNLINGMFDAWDKELDFGLEAQNARQLADNVKRFRVAQTIEVGTKNGQNISMVQEKAKGIALDDLLEMIELYNKNKSEYFIKYADKIEKNPALKTPENWMSDLGTAYQKAQNEQAMFIGKSGTRTIHADPHKGNVFVDFDVKTGKPNIIYIDAGNVAQRTNIQTLKDIALSLNMMIGNSQGIADAMLEGATLPNGADKKELSKKFAKLLDERLYHAGVDLKNTQYTQNTINGIMKELNIIPDSGNSNLMKATLQRIETSREINSICGTTSSKVVDIEDLAAGILKSFKVNPKETLKTIKPIIKWAYQNNDQAMITFFQMIMKQAEKQN